jgi:hypothetical protein
MGFFSSLLGAAAPIVGGIVGGPAGAAIGGALGGALSSATAPKSTSTNTSGNSSSTSQQQIDPRIASILFGGNGQPGFLNQAQGFLNQPQSQGSQFIGDLSSNYLNGGAGDDINAIRNAGYNLLKGNQAPTIGAAVANAAQINAPSQNALNLNPAYQNFIYGNAAENPYLTKSLQSGINQSNQAFQTQLGDITNNLQRSILPGIRGNAIASGQFGSSRQGIAEGLALSDLNRQATNAAQQLGLANISATTGAQANAFNQGQDRSLNALNTLSGQQYNTALTQAQLNQQAELANAAARQAADNTNVNAGLATQAQNNAALLGGSGLLSGNLAQLYGYNQNANNAGINRAQQVGSLISPFIGVNSTVNQTGTQTGSNTTPLYQNTAGNILGGALTGVGLANQFGGLAGFGGSRVSGVNTGNGSYGGGPSGTYYDGSSYVPYA